MKTMEKLTKLRDYYLSTRQKGHTTLMKKGTDNVENKLVLCYHYNSGKAIGFKDKELVSWNGLGRLIGNDKPLAIDNGIMTVILSDAIEEIEKLEEEIEALRDSLEEQRWMFSDQIAALKNM